MWCEMFYRALVGTACLFQLKIFYFWSESISNIYEKKIILMVQTNPTRTNMVLAVQAY